MVPHVLQRETDVFIRKQMYRYTIPCLLHFKEVTEKAAGCVTSISEEKVHEAAVLSRHTLPSFTFIRFMQNWEGMDLPILSRYLEAGPERSGDLSKVTQHLAGVRDLGANPSSSPYQPCD